MRPPLVRKIYLTLLVISFVLLILVFSWFLLPTEPLYYGCETSNISCGDVSALAFDRNAKMISCLVDGFGIVEFDIASQKKTREVKLDVDAFWVSELLYLDDDHLCLVCSSELLVLDLSKNKYDTFSIPGVRCAAYATMKNHILFGTRGGKLGVVCLNSKKIDFFNLKSAGCIWSIALSADEEIALLGDSENSVYIIRMGVPELATLINASSEVYKVLISKDGLYGIIGCSDGSVSCFDISSRRFLWTSSRHWSSVRHLSFVSSSEEVLSGALDSRIMISDLSSGGSLANQSFRKMPFRFVCSAPDTRKFAVAYKNGGIGIWEFHLRRGGQKSGSSY